MQNVHVLYIQIFKYSQYLMSKYFFLTNYAVKQEY